MKTTLRRPTRARFVAALALGAALAVTPAFAGTASAAEDSDDPTLGGGAVPAIVETALETKEGCDYPGILVPVIAQVSREAVEGCGYFETDPAHPNYPDGE